MNRDRLSFFEGLVLVPLETKCGVFNYDVIEDNLSERVISSVRVNRVGRENYCAVFNGLTFGIPGNENLSFEGNEGLVDDRIRDCMKYICRELIR